MVPFLLLIVNAILLVPCDLLFQAKFMDMVRRIGYRTNGDNWRSSNNKRTCGENL